MRLLRLLIVLLALPAFAQQGGMWIPSLLKGMNEKEMKHLGMKMTAQDIYDVNHSSMKDGVPQFNGGCTSEVISSQGLLLTNHHCGFGEIQSHSTIEHDYLTDGFWAKTQADELPNPGLEVTFIVRIEDVTTKVLDGTLNLAEKDRVQKIQDNISNLSKTLPKEKWQDNSIRTFYEGNQYMLFVTESFKDVRLVGAPPSSIGKFGSDTDNWVWPRHTGDFSLFRIYAGKDNRPAAYSKDNVPYVPKYYFPVSLKGIKEDDFTLVFGYPGRTTEYLPAVAVKQIVEVLNPAKIEIRDAALKVADSFMRKDPAIKIQYAAKYASIANYWKKWIGETQGLKKTNAVDLKKAYEKEFAEWVKKAGKEAEYGKLLEEFDRYYNGMEPFALARDYFNEVVIRNTELLNVGYRLFQLEQVLKTKGSQTFGDRAEKALASFEDIYKDFNKDVDAKIFEQLITLYFTKSPDRFLPREFLKVDAKKLTAEIYKNSKLTSIEGVRSLMAGDPGAVIAKLNDDDGYKFVKILAEAYQKKVTPKYDEINLKIASLQRTYMKAILELSPKDARLFPDANSTLRVTYGKVKGYKPGEDDTYYDAQTYLDGVIKKYVPGDYEFDVPKKLIDLYNKKDYGQYGEKGKMPVCFIGTNHTTGGNSGSPAIDANGNLIGLNFDRVWEGTMSDIHYDPSICRNIMVDIRYVLFIIDKYAGAGHLVKEMKLVK
ncbi:S46 family peptidase [Flavobacterium subsaxonicum]|uniref:Dipeptidyl-peptidase n=1 Tax=Flavobacterium subsaxonicum WB 4.1-42 = DSM 21790 TaxID=1121898 RepID=A0A0A2MHR4_9FLAO|nr:S46 family peptidase [Flavobacterium subsaxonicum]KGO92152.1 peptidase S46 [Flavobacterium subsaxonicum WB 4.1-42 = DSM 21790]